MARLIVPDTCAIAAALFKERFSNNADPLLAAIRTKSVEAAAPSVFLSEFLNICRKKVAGFQKAPRVPIADVNAALNDLFSLPITWIPVEPYYAIEAWTLHATHQIETNDAFFLFLAQQCDAELWTTDIPFYAKASLLHPRTFELESQPFV